jgi:hypothetical protein
MVLNKSKGSVRGYIFPRLIFRVLKPPSRYLSREDQWPCLGAKSWSDESESDSRSCPEAQTTLAPNPGAIWAAGQEEIRPANLKKK